MGALAWGDIGSQNHSAFSYSLRKQTSLDTLHLPDVTLGAFSLQLLSNPRERSEGSLMWIPLPVRPWEYERRVLLSLQNPFDHLASAIIWFNPFVFTESNSSPSRCYRDINLDPGWTRATSYWDYYSMTILILMSSHWGEKVPPFLWLSTWNCKKIWNKMWRACEF